MKKAGAIFYKIVNQRRKNKNEKPIKIYVDDWGISNGLKLSRN